MPLPARRDAARRRGAQGVLRRAPLGRGLAAPRRRGRRAPRPRRGPRARARAPRVRDQPRALRRAHRQAGVRRPLVHPRERDARRRWARPLAERGGAPQAGGGDGAPLPGPPRVARALRGDRRRVPVLAARAQVPVPERVRPTDRRVARRAAAPADVRGRAAALPAGPARRGARADREGARARALALGRALLPERARRHRDGARARPALPGPRERRQQRGVLLPGHHLRRPVAEQPALRALPLGRAPRASRHRRGLRARAPRRGHPGHLREVRPRPRRDGERGHLVSRQERAARGRQGVRPFARAGRSPGRARGVVGQARRDRRRPAGRVRVRSEGRPRAARPGDGARHRRLPAAPLHPRRRLRPQRRAALERRAGGARDDAEPHGHPVGQGRPRHARVLQGGRAGPGHAHRDPQGARHDLDAGRARRHERDRPPRGDPRGGPARIRRAVRGRHGRRLPDREPRADGDAPAAPPEGLLRPRRRGGHRAAGADPGRDGAPVPAPSHRAGGREPAAPEAREHSRIARSASRSSRSR